MKSKWVKYGGSVLAALLLTFIIAAPQEHHSSQPQNKQTDPFRSQAIERRNPQDLFKVAPIGRRLYPYSVIPGGLTSTEELRSAVKNDPVVARHYEGFELARTRIVALQRPLSAYVSYRIGEDVFWTRHKLNLATGETVVSDGARMARTRCGNRISETPQLPISAKEPSSESLESALEPAFVTSPEELITYPRSFSQPVRTTQNFAKTDVEPPFGPIIPPIWWVPDSPIVPVTPVPPETPPVTPPQNIPEPGTGAFLLFGMLLVTVATKWRSWASRS